MWCNVRFAIYGKRYIIDSRSQKINLFLLLEMVRV